MYPTTDPVALLCALLRDGDRTLAARALGPAKAPAVRALVAAGVLVPGGIVERTLCTECDEPHLVDVVTDGPNGLPGWQCPEVGFVTADRNELAAYTLSISGAVDLLVKAFTAAFGNTRSRARQLPETRAWLVGVWPIDAVMTTVVLTPTIDTTGDARRLNAALATLVRRDAGVVLVLDEAPDFEVGARFAVLSLGDAIRLDAEGKVDLDDRVMVQTVTPLAAGAKMAHGGRPSVEAMVRVIFEHLLTRGSHGSSDDINAGIVLRAWPEFFAPEDLPAQQTIRRHLRTIRSSRR